MFIIILYFMQIQLEALHIYHVPFPHYNKFVIIGKEIGKKYLNRYLLLM